MVSLDNSRQVAIIGIGLYFALAAAVDAQGSSQPNMSQPYASAGQTAGSSATQTPTLSETAGPTAGQAPSNSQIPGQVFPSSGQSLVPGLVNTCPPSVGWPNNPQTFAQNFWKGAYVNQVNAGTIINGTLQNDLSSKTSKVGDVFSIVLDQGYTNQGCQLIPPASKILGTVTSVKSAKSNANGMPGTVNINLQTLVIPDGRTAPISALIQYNPSQASNPNQNQISKSKYNAIPLGSYGSSLKTMGLGLVTSVTRVFGVRYSPKRYQKAGKEFSISQGQSLAIKLIAPLDLSNLK